jgi:hypothetical protein
LTEVVELRREVERLQKQAPRPIDIPNLAGLDESVHVDMSYSQGSWKDNTGVNRTWREIFSTIAALMHPVPTWEASVKSTLAERLSSRSNSSLADHSFETIQGQFQALGLITVTQGQSASGAWMTFWGLAPAGDRLMYELRTVRTSKATE